MNQIYTYIGDILIAVNPFKPLKIYSDEVSNQFTIFMMKVITGKITLLIYHLKFSFQYANRYRSADITKYDPHIYAIAGATYNDLIINKRNQV